MLYIIKDKKTGELKEVYCEAPYKFCDNKECPCQTDQGDNMDETNEDYLYETN